MKKTSSRRGTIGYRLMDVTGTVGQWGFGPPLRGSLCKDLEQVLYSQLLSTIDCPVCTPELWEAGTYVAQLYCTRGEHVEL